MIFALASQPQSLFKPPRDRSSASPTSTRLPSAYPLIHRADRRDQIAENRLDALLTRHRHLLPLQVGRQRGPIALTCTLALTPVSVSLPRATAPPLGRAAPPRRR